jgi:hypothetical protein
MAPLTIPAAVFIAQLAGAAEGQSWRILDIAAGHGMYGITLAQQNPKAQITAVDWPAVREVAKENAESAGVTNRYTTRAGSAFEVDLGDGYDLVLLTNIFYHFDKPTCVPLIARVHQALKSNGKAITLEFVPNEDRISPPTIAGFSLLMLADGCRGGLHFFGISPHVRECRVRAKQPSSDTRNAATGSAIGENGLELRSAPEMKVAF